MILLSQRNQEHNTTGIHFTSFEMALGPLWPFAVPNKYIYKGARHKRIHPNDNTFAFPTDAATEPHGMRCCVSSALCCVCSPIS